MDTLLAVGMATAGDIRERMPQTASYSAVRAVLRVLEEKGLITHKYDGPRYVYKPVVPERKAKESILKRVLDNFFEGSREKLVTALLETGEDDPGELDRLARLIRKARKQGK